MPWRTLPGVTFDLPRPSELSDDAPMEDYFRAARAHGIELSFPWTVTLPEDKRDPAGREVPFRGRDGEWSERMRQEHMRPTIERFVIDNDMKGLGDPLPAGPRRLRLLLPGDLPDLRARAGPRPDGAAHEGDGPGVAGVAGERRAV